MLAGGSLGRTRCGQRGLCGLGGLALVLDRRAGGDKFAVDVGKAAALRQAACGARRGVGVGGKAVPAPKIAVARNEALAGLELAGEARAVGTLDHADLGEAAGQFRRRLHELGERLRRLPAAPGRLGRSRRPSSAWRGWIDRCIKIVAERSAERHLIALLDGDLVDHRRPHALGLDRQQLHQRLGFGIEALRRALGIGQRKRARHRGSCARVPWAASAASAACFGLGDCGLRAFDRGRECGEIGPALRDGRKAGLDIGDFAFDPGDALGLLARGLR